MGVAVAQTPPPGFNSKIVLCRAITDDAARLRCYEAATSTAPTVPPASPVPPIASPPQASTAAAGQWRLTRTPNPTGGRDAVSIIQTADIAKSDIDLAGLMIRCGETNLETLVVLVSPLPPRAQPKITVSAAGASTDFIGTVVPPGAEVLLPDEVSVLVSGPWKVAPELAVRVQNESEKINGVIPLAGLAAALPNLTANCTAR